MENNKGYYRVSGVQELGGESLVKKRINQGKKMLGVTCKGVVKKQQLILFFFLILLEKHWLEFSYKNYILEHNDLELICNMLY